MCWQGWRTSSWMRASIVNLCMPCIWNAFVMAAWTGKLYPQNQACWWRIIHWLVIALVGQRNAIGKHICGCPGMNNLLAHKCIFPGLPLWCHHSHCRVWEGDWHLASSEWYFHFKPIIFEYDLNALLQLSDYILRVAAWFFDTENSSYSRGYACHGLLFLASPGLHGEA